MFIWMADLVSSFSAELVFLLTTDSLVYRFTSDTCLFANFWDTLHSYGSSHSESVFFILGFRPTTAAWCLFSIGKWDGAPTVKQICDAWRSVSLMRFDVSHIHLWRLYCFPSNPVPVTRVAMGSENVYMGAFDVWNNFFLPINLRVTCLGFAKSQTVSWTCWWW